MVELKSNEEIATQYNVKSSYVSHLVHRIKKNPSYFSDRACKKEEKESVEDFIFEIANDIIKSG